MYLKSSGALDPQINLFTCDGVDILDDNDPICFLYSGRVLMFCRGMNHINFAIITGAKMYCFIGKSGCETFFFTILGKFTIVHKSRRIEEVR